MKIATWNVNSVRKRTGNLVAWLEHAKPDVVVLQEIKTQERAVPAPRGRGCRLQGESCGQKGFNGVAILADGQSTVEPARALPGAEPDDVQARYIEGRIRRRTGRSPWAASTCPTAIPIGTEKFDYKIAWMERLHQRARDLLAREEIDRAGRRLQRHARRHGRLSSPKAIAADALMPARVARGLPARCSISA